MKIYNFIIDDLVRGNFSVQIDFKGARLPSSAGLSKIL
jgi:hypothetical protein